MMIRRNGHPIAFHIDGIGESQALQSGSREGIWWLPHSTANDWLVVSNQGKNTVPLDLSLYDARGNAHRQQVLLGPGETTRYSVRRLTHKRRALLVLMEG